MTVVVLTEAAAILGKFSLLFMAKRSIAMCFLAILQNCSVSTFFLWFSPLLVIHCREPSCLLLATDVGDCCLVHWCRARDCCMVSYHTAFHNSIPTCTLFQCFVNQWAASLHAACFCALFTSEQHPYITFFFQKFLSLFPSLFCSVQQLHEPI